MRWEMQVKYKNIYLSHLGDILSNYSILGLSLMALVLMGSVASFVFYLFTFTFGLLLTVGTLGTIFLMNKQLMRWLFVDSSSIMVKVIEISNKAFPYVLAVTLAMSVASLIILCFQKQSKSSTRITLAIVGIVLAVVFGALYLIMGLNK